MRFCIEFSKNQDWKKSLLYSNRTLENVIYMYSKYGFGEIPLEGHPSYQQSNIKMEFLL